MIPYINKNCLKKITVTINIVFNLHNISNCGEQCKCCKIFSVEEINNYVIKCNKNKNDLKGQNIYFKICKKKPKMLKAKESSNVLHVSIHCLNFVLRNIRLATIKKK